MSKQISWLEYARELLVPIIAKGKAGWEWDDAWGVLDEWVSEDDCIKTLEWLWTEYPAYMAENQVRITARLARREHEFSLMRSGVKLQDTPPEMQAHYNKLYGEDAAAAMWDRDARAYRGDAAEEMEG